jgi:hypothetical protein
MLEGINFSEIEDFVEGASRVCAEEISSGMSRNTKVDDVREILLIGKSPSPVIYWNHRVGGKTRIKYPGSTT